MSDTNGGDDNKKKGPDPYDFFKLAPEGGGNGKNSGGKKGGFPFWLILLILISALAVINIFFASKTENLVDFSEFRTLIKNGTIHYVELGETYFTGYESAPVKNTSLNSLDLLAQNAKSPQSPVFRTSGVLTEDFLKLLDEKNVTYKFAAKQNGFMAQIFWSLIVPLIFILLMYFFIFKKMGGGLSGSLFGAGGSRANAVGEGEIKTRFKDVAGVDEAKEELVEVVDFLKSPKKYTDIGGKIPKGVLLVGPPGTGKTLLARAVAGEAGVPFFRISGSDFVEMFVGVGASRVRDLFNKAREKSPCIIFIDELDAIGKSRINSYSSNDEREQTLNQLLVEMDGFDASSGLIILAATNRPDVLDPALLRPGRFDRQVAVDLPDAKGREAILKIHSKDVKLEGGVDLTGIARTTSGFSGADLANVINEAALLAVRNGRKLVKMEDLDAAVEKSIVGLKKTSRVLKDKVKRNVAFHETGHALVAAFTEGADPVHKISIIPHGIGTLGFTMHMPDDDVHLYTAEELLAEVDVLLGGRAAEKIVFGKVSTGASSDIQRATDIVRKMLTDYGMSGKFENVALTKRGSGAGDPQLVREYAETTQQYIDEQIAESMAKRYKVVLDLLEKKRVLLDYIANRLLEKETMEEAEFNDIVKAEGHSASLHAELA
ncbi:MAG: ATP-dependent zinc metalloprotease FtsH [Treponemataceae bacterium]|nr:MAG: ATP-dependent zinc metalloprotease FtsH [Treponemataceae bacterium]